MKGSPIAIVAPLVTIILAILTPITIIFFFKYFSQPIADYFRWKRQEELQKAIDNILKNPDLTSEQKQQAIRQLLQASESISTAFPIPAWVEQLTIAIIIILVIALVIIMVKR